ncbi:MAG TPA: class I SAM-dependent methyltransferase [Stellaceae bacterium]|nr:class I SAM-dependent methyltransferase [Stellaceae bacterium]
MGGFSDDVAVPNPDLAVLRSLVRRFDGTRAIEIGSWLGTSALAMRAAGAAEVHCVDTWRGTDDPRDDARLPRGTPDGELLRAFCEKVGPELGDGIRPYVGESLFWASVWPWRADLVFIDADHRHEAALADIRAWTPHVRPGGILCGHDYSQHWPGVVRAVHETGAFETSGAVWWRLI